MQSVDERTHRHRRYQHAIRHRPEKRRSVRRFRRFFGRVFHFTATANILLERKTLLLQRDRATRCLSRIQSAAA